MVLALVQNHLLRNDESSAAQVEGLQSETINRLGQTIHSEPAQDVKQQLKARFYCSENWRTKKFAVSFFEDKKNTSAIPNPCRFVSIRCGDTADRSSFFSLGIATASERGDHVATVLRVWRTIRCLRRDSVRPSGRPELPQRSSAGDRQGPFRNVCMCKILHVALRGQKLSVYESAGSNTAALHLECVKSNKRPLEDDDRLWHSATGAGHHYRRVFI